MENRRYLRRNRPPCQENLAHRPAGLTDARRKWIIWATFFPTSTHLFSPGGEIGRRARLKISSGLGHVQVQVLSRAFFISDGRIQVAVFIANQLTGSKTITKHGRQPGSSE